MARIEWAALCDLAFFDRQDRLCIIGMFRQLPVPSLPLALSQVMLVAKLTDIRPVEELSISIGVVAPSGRSPAPSRSDGIVIEMAREYVLATLRDVPIFEEGVYRFQIALGGQALVSVDLPALTVARPSLAEVH
jgi:hypothetical protein